MHTRGRSPQGDGRTRGRLDDPDGNLRGAVPNGPNTVVPPHQLSRFGKILLLVLMVYAVAIILPDTLRPTALYQVAYYLEGLGPGRRSTESSWYPLGMVCFAADNDGNVTSLDDCGRGQDQLQEGDRIDLRTTEMTYRRAVIQGGGWVAHDRPVILHVVRANAGPIVVRLNPIREDLQFFGRTWPDTWTLMLEQVAGLFFIGLAALCVWRAPSPVTWGFFLYGIYFNPGDVQVWYANLPADALRWVGWAQAVFAGVGLASLVMFALYFPHHRVKAWRRAALLLLVLFVALTGLNVWSFRNFTAGESTERVYHAYYYLVLATYLAIFAVFLRTYITRPEDRPRIRWVILGALSGLLCFIFAEVYTQTSMLDNLPTIPQWLWQMLYAANVLFPLTVAYAILRHRVINIRLILNRSVVAVFGFIVVLIAFAVLDLAFHTRVVHVPGIALIGAIGFGFVHERLRGIMDVMDWLFYRRWYIAERDLKREMERLTQAIDIEVVNRALIDLPAKELNLTAALLFERQSDGSFYRAHATPSWPGKVLEVIPANHQLITSLVDRPVMLPDRYWKKPSPPPYPIQMPILAVPIVIGRALSRIALFGPHTNGETFDRDELNVIRRLARAAALAYATLEAEEVENLRLQNRMLEERLRGQTSTKSAQETMGEK